MNDTIYRPAKWAIDAIGASLHGEEALHVLPRLAEQDLTPRAAADPGPQQLRATRYFAECVAGSMFVAPDVAAALADLGEFLHWKQNPNYSDDVMGQGYMDDYAYAEIIGPQGFFAGEDFLLGLLLLGPHRFYRDHAHKAPELYWLLTGPSEWRQGGGDFAQRQAGATIWHAPDMVHATRTGDTPLLAVWVWPQDVKEAARLVAQG